jgi:hypothetical protein
MPVGMMKMEYTEQSIQKIRIHKHSNKNLSDRTQKSGEGLENNRCLSRDSNPGKSPIKVAVFIAGDYFIGMMKTIGSWSYVLTLIRNGTLQFFTLRTFEILKPGGRNSG